MNIQIVNVPAALTCHASNTNLEITIGLFAPMFRGRDLATGQTIACDPKTNVQYSAIPGTPLYHVGPEISFWIIMLFKITSPYLSGSQKKGTTSRNYF